MTLYAVRLPHGSTSPEDVDVVDETKYGWEYLGQAIALWRLADPTRGDAIFAIKERAYSAPGTFPRLDADDIRNLVDLIDGIDDAIVRAGIVDAEWRVPVDRLEELARRVPGMDINAERSLEDKRYALAEVVSNVLSLRGFLAEALQSGCVVVYN